VRYFARRILFFLLTLWATVTLNFLIPRLQPGDPAEAIVRKLVGQNVQIHPAQIAAIRVMLEDAESVRATAEDLDPLALSAIVDLLIGARRVYVFGARGSFGLAVILAMGLRLLLPDARLLNQTGGDLPDQLLDMNAEDVLVAISFRRVDRASVDVLKHAARIGAASVGIGDHLSGPLARTASRMLITRMGPLRLMPSYAVGASLINAVATAVSVHRHGASAPHLRAAETLWREFGTYADG